MDGEAGEHERLRAELGAWAVDACSAEDAVLVEAHLATCAACAAEADRLRQAGGWLGVEEAVAPPAGLRATVLAAALRARPAGAPPATGQAEVYAAQVDAMDSLVGELSAEQWRQRVVHDWTVNELLAHLTSTDGTLAGELGLPAASTAGTRAAWRSQADAVLRQVAVGGPAALDRPVRLAGQEPAREPTRLALAQRAFETWVHGNDIRAALGRPPRDPPAGLVSNTIALGVRLLPAALRRAGAEHPGRTAELVLEGAGGGRWTVPLGPGAAGGAADVTVIAKAADFCALMGNRRDPAELPHTVSGDPALAADLLRAATTLGCD
jgi:uncharacterized protein (TIGR03083 family)